jgi:hypothetical protein
VTLARTTLLGGLLLALAMGRPLGAQARSVVELGASYVRFPEDSVSIAGPSVRWVASQARGALASTISVSGVASTSGASGYGEVGGQWLAPLGAGWRAELSGDGGGLLSTASGSSSLWSTSVVTSARLLRPVGSGGVWVRGSGNVATREAGLLWGRGVDVGGWWRRAGLQLVTNLTREWSVAQLFTGPGRRGFAGVVPVHYTEGNLGMLVEGNTSSLAVTGQVRRDPGAEHLVEPGYTATVTVWRSPTQAFLVSVARQLPDFVHGAEASQSVTVGIRLNEPSPAVARVRATRPIVQIGEVSAAADGSEARPCRALRVRAPAASRVEVMGDFTEWEPAELAPAGDVFSARFELSTGSHRLVVRIDGGPWMPAANTPAVDDDFGGRVGLLVVP